MDRRQVTTDCHYPLPHSIVDRLPAKYQEHFPRLEQREDGTYLVRPKPTEEQLAEMGKRVGGTGGTRGQNLMATMAGGDAGKGTKVEDAAKLARQGNVCPESEPSYDPVEMLAELERDGVYGAVLISGGGNRAAAPPEAQIAYCQAVNDYQAETWSPYYDRVAPGIALPIDDIEASVKELERAAGMGLRPALMPEGLHGRPYHLPEWEPIWEACNSLKVPITMHISGSRSPFNLNSYVHPGPGETIYGFYMSGCDFGETIGWFTFAGIFERYPDLHIVCTEGYAGWLAFAIQVFDHHFKEYYPGTGLSGEGRFGPWTSQWMEGYKELEAPPSYYVKRQAHATFMWDPVAINNREFTGLDCLMWGNDYPHHEGSFPYSQEWCDKMFAGVPEDEVDQIVRGNANRIFGLSV